METPIHSKRKQIRQTGFTLIEIISVLATIAFVGTLAITLTAATVERSADQKLRSDVNTLNQAVNMYLANGGDLSTATDSTDVLNRLKTKLSDEDANRFAGLPSSMVDARILPIFQTEEEALTDQLRAAWDHDEQRFILGDAGDPGIKKFYFSDALADSATEIETRSHTGFMYAFEDEWIWDYEERPQLSPTQVTTVNIYFRDDSDETVLPWTSIYDIPEEEDPYVDSDPDPESLPILTPPLITPGEGEFNFDEFPLEVTIIDRNDPETSIIRYSVNQEAFKNYTAPFMVNPDDEVLAYAAALNPEEYVSSSLVTATYGETPEEFTGKHEGKFNHGGKKGNNGHGNNIDGVDSSNPGKAPFTDPSGDYDDEKSLGSVVNYTKENGLGTFTMGTAVNGGTPNTLKYKGTQFIQVEPEEMFKVGHIDYFNGTILSGTGADIVTLEMEVSMTSPDQVETVPVFIGFHNTANTSNNDWDNADSVVIRYRTIPLQQKLNGKTYYMVLSLGETSAPLESETAIGGMTVLEGKTGSAPIYGYFTENPPAP